MKKKQKLFLGFVIVIMAVFSLAGCDLDKDEDKNPEFPSQLRGTWVRENSSYSNTLTFTSTTLKDSNRDYHWNLMSISGNTYEIESSTSSKTPGSIIAKLESGILNIVDNYADYTSSGWLGTIDDWSGNWKRQ